MTVYYSRIGHHLKFANESSDKTLVVNIFRFQQTIAILARQMANLTVEARTSHLIIEKLERDKS